MSSCCDEYGTCTQGRDCPARTGKVLPHQAAHARKVAGAQGVAPIKSSRPKWMDGKATARTCDALGVCQGRGDCACTHPVPPEAGNFKIEYLGPYDDGQPLTRDESMALVRTLLAWLAWLAGIVAVVLLVRFDTGPFSLALWQFLGGLS